MTDNITVQSDEKTNYICQIFKDIILASSSVHLEDESKNKEAETFSVQPEQQDVKSQHINNACAYIKSHFHESITLATIADAIHINHTYLSTIFKKEMGISITAYINNIRLFSAAEMIKNSHLSITDIALTNGFSNPSYFAQAFKVQFGKSPHEYRQEYAPMI